VAFRLRRSHSIDRDVRRIADHQLQLAIVGMRTVGTRTRDASVHEARRRIKKVRALVLLVGPALEGPHRRTRRRLRTVTRLLGVITDADAVIDTVGRLGRRYPGELPRRMLASIRKELVRRCGRIDRRVAATHGLRACARIVRAERRRVRDWRLKEHGFGAVATGLEKSVFRAARAMTRAAAHPTAHNVHAWRRCVKVHWFQVRLLEGRCGDALAAWEHDLELLDGYLGEYHDSALLQRVLVTEPLLGRQETARALRLLRRYQHEIRREAQRLAAQIYEETPRQFVKRVKRLWRSADKAGAAPMAPAAWPKAA
jgi:CHAD domain-containing protein